MYQLQFCFKWVGNTEFTIVKIFLQVFAIFADPVQRTVSSCQMQSTELSILTVHPVLAKRAQSSNHVQLYCPKNRTTISIISNTNCSYKMSHYHNIISPCHMSEPKHINPCYCQRHNQASCEMVTGKENGLSVVAAVKKVAVVLRLKVRQKVLLLQHLRMSWKNQLKLPRFIPV